MSLQLSPHPLHLEQQVVHLGVFPEHKQQTTQTHDDHSLLVMKKKYEKLLWRQFLRETNGPGFASSVLPVHDLRSSKVLKISPLWDQRYFLSLPPLLLLLLVPLNNVKEASRCLVTCRHGRLYLQRAPQE